MILSIITIVAVGFFITEFEPLHYVLNALKDKADNKVASFFIEMFSCWKCATFWTGLILTQDFFVACIAVLSTVIVERWIEK